jgi:hypothetical protein
MSGFAPRSLHVQKWPTGSDILNTSMDDSCGIVFQEICDEIISDTL